MLSPPAPTGERQIIAAKRTRSLSPQTEAEKAHAKKQRVEQAVAKARARVASPYEWLQVIFAPPFTRHDVEMNLAPTNEEDETGEDDESDDVEDGSTDEDDDSDESEDEYDNEDVTDGEAEDDAATEAEAQFVPHIWRTEP